MHHIFNIKKAMIVALAFALSSYGLHSAALSMGEIQVKSVLGQPLLAHVKISDADSRVGESCFTVSSEDPDNGVTLKFNPSEALITIQSLQAVSKPAMVLTLSNHCQAPSKRHYIFFVNSQGLSANSDQAKNATPKKMLSEQFHYQRTFNKLTKQTELDDTRGLPDRLMYEDRFRDDRLNNKAAPITTEGLATDSLRANEPGKDLGLSGDKLNKRTKPADKVTDKPFKNSAIAPKTVSSTSSLAMPQGKSSSTFAPENKLALAKTISDHESKAHASITPVSNPLDSNNQTETKPPLNSPALSGSAKPASISAENTAEQDVESGLMDDNPLMTEEQLATEQRMFELQAQLTELYKINSSLDILFKKMNHELTSVKKENDFLRSLTLCLGVTLMLSGYFFADWLRRKKSQPVYDREPAMWTDLSGETATTIRDASIPRQANDSTQTSTVAVKKAVADQTFASTHQTNENKTTPSTPMPSSASVVEPNIVDPNIINPSNVDPFDVIPDFKVAVAQGLNNNKPPANIKPIEDQALSKQTPAPNNNVDLGNVKVSEESKLSPPLLIGLAPKLAETAGNAIPTLTVTRVVSPATPKEPTTDQPGAFTAADASQEKQAPTSPSTTSATPATHSKEAIKVQSAGVMDDVDVFLSHGRTNLAIQLLQNYLMEHPKESALVWILLLDLLAKEGKRREYEITSDECRKHFNITLSDFSVPIAPHNDSIESFERISAALQKVWGTPLVLSFIDELIYNTRLVPRMGFNRAIFEELMLLRELAEDELRMEQTLIQPTPASQTNPHVSDEFKQLADDLKTQDHRKQDVNQYLSEFEFNLEELNK